jgi:protein disulfide-isomerase-like protein
VPLPAAYSDVPPRPQNFDQVVGSNRFVLVYFYAPWCSFCKALTPEYAAAAAQLALLGNRAVLAKVDADSTAGGQRLAERFNVTGFPTLIWFVNGRSQSYDGLLQDRSDIVFWVVSQTDDITRSLTEQVFTPLDLLPFQLQPPTSNRKPPRASLRRQRAVACGVL